MQIRLAYKCQDNNVTAQKIGVRYLPPWKDSQLLANFDPCSLDPLPDVILQMRGNIAGQAAGNVGEMKLDITSLVHGPVCHYISHGILQPAVMSP